MYRSTRARLVAGAIVAAVVLLVSFVALVYVSAQSSNSTSGTQVASKGIVRHENSNGTWTVWYILYLVNGTQQKVPNLTTYREVQIGGSYNPKTGTVLTPEEEQVNEGHQGTTHNGTGNNSGEHQPADEAPPVEHPAPVEPEPVFHEEP